MGEYELGMELRRMYDTAPKGNQAVAIHLFGIRFWRELSAGGVNKKAILRAAGLQESYHTEISKGQKLGQYVSIKDDTTWYSER